MPKVNEEQQQSRLEAVRKGLAKCTDTVDLSMKIATSLAMTSMSRLDLPPGSPAMENGSLALMQMMGKFMPDMMVEIATIDLRCVAIVLAENPMIFEPGELQQILQQILEGRAAQREINRQP
jgi:hypothetical protein